MNRMKEMVPMALAMILALAAQVQATTPGQRCQGRKNAAAGQYAACRQTAEGNLAKNGDLAKYAVAINKCETKLAAKWRAFEKAAAAAHTTCPDAPLMESQFKNVIDEHTDNIATALGGGGLQDCPADLTTCNGSLTTCNGSLGTCNANYSTCSAGLTTCNGNLTTCSGNLTTCNANYSTCSSSLSTCTAGTAATGDVLSGKTFSSAAGLGATGIMVNNGAVSITPGASAKVIPKGYHNGSGTVAGDADLVAANIKTGVNLFGVTGTAPPPPLTTGQMTSYGTGTDGDLQKGAPRAYTDNGDGTITDNTTGLMWEKKDDAGGIHDKDNTYTNGMTSSPFTMNGTLVTTFLAALNTPSCFAGHCDWRIPSLNELQSLVNYQNLNPAVNTVFNTGCVASCTVTTCSCTQSNYYWSSTTYRNSPDGAWFVDFNGGIVYPSFKSYSLYARAVRGGS